ASGAVEPVQLQQARMEAESVARDRVVVDREQVRGGDLQVRARGLVERALRAVERDDHVEAVVPAFHLDDDDDRAGRAGRVRHAAEDRMGNRERGGGRGARLQEIASGDRHGRPPAQWTWNSGSESANMIAPRTFRSSVSTSMKLVAPSK